jgi:hypothetical protein
MSIMRIGLQNVDVADDKMFFDVMVANADHLPVKGHPAFGFSGSFSKPVDSFPLTLFSDGTIDIGCFAPIEVRYHRTNLLNHPMVVGEYVSIWWKEKVEREITFQIRAVTKLDSGFEHAPATDLMLGKIREYRAELVKSFDVEISGQKYRPPVGLQGSIAKLHGRLFFEPDGAILDDQQIGLTVEEDEVRVI